MIASIQLVALVVVALLGAFAQAARDATSPNNPSASFTFADKSQMYITVDGTPATVMSECRGLMGGSALTFATVYTKFTDGTPAYKVQMFEDWDCTGRILGSLTHFEGTDAYPWTVATDTGDRIEAVAVVPKSFRFIAL
ncbi:hypothetical protein BC828DRAFT_378303 [Blastocladiella britannica]|nr:hypothetical protein BC828DRAFT_378303 [Blastocladiella britannica]